MIHHVLLSLDKGLLSLCCALKKQSLMKANVSDIEGSCFSFCYCHVIIKEKKIKVSADSIVLIFARLDKAAGA